LFSIIASKLKYNKDEFLSLTPVECNLILQNVGDNDEHFFNFFLNEFRTNNFYTLKSSFADTKRFKKPDALYTLPFEAEQKELNRLRAIEKAKSGFDKDDKELLTKLGYL